MLSSGARSLGLIVWGPSCLDTAIISTCTIFSQFSLGSLDTLRSRTAGRLRTTERQKNVK